MNADLEHIFIIGSGAIGKALAVFLKRAGKQVTLIRASVNDGEESTERIIVEMANLAPYEDDLNIATLNHFSKLPGIIVLANKSFGNVQLAAKLKAKTENSPIVLLQNGLGIEHTFIDQNYPELYRCVLFVTSQSLPANTVRFKPINSCPIGIERGNLVNLHHITSHLTTPELKFYAEPNIRPVIWKKAIVNCVFNSVCVLLDVDNGIFYRNAAVLEIAKRIIAECTALANAQGIYLQHNEVETSLLEISRLSDGQLISTLQDIKCNRRTEIDTLNLEIARIAKQLNQKDLVKETRLLGELTRLKADINIEN